MATPYSVLIGDFLDKVAEYKFLQYSPEDNNQLAKGYLIRACAQFNPIFSKRTKFNLDDRDDELEQFNFDFPDRESIDVITDGMVMQWMKPYANNSENLENFLNTKDYSMNSTANLLSKVRSTYQEAREEFRNRMNQYSYNHGELDQLHM